MIATFNLCFVEICFGKTKKMHSFVILKYLHFSVPVKELHI